MQHAGILQKEDICDVRTIHEDSVARAKAQAIDPSELLRLSSVFKALSDPTRLSIVMSLLDQEMCVCDLAASLDVTESAVSHQLRKLRDLALVKNRREGPTLYYSLDDDHVAELLATGLDHVRE
jgi:ArsR family transcriptional regulator, lead/cadmium/zinc/bismuth-responsive transcriptional repressor